MLPNGNLRVPLGAIDEDGTLGDELVEISPAGELYEPWLAWIEATGYRVPRVAE
jgi:hypothetical protein